MRHRKDAPCLQMSNEPVAAFGRRQPHVEHVITLHARRRNGLKDDLTVAGPLRELRGITRPEAAAPILHPLAIFELRTYHRRQKLGGKVARADVDPSVFVHLATEEPAAVSALFPHDFRSVDEGSIVDQKRSTLTACEVLGFVKAECRERSNRAEILASITAKEPVRVVFYDGRTTRGRSRLSASISQATPA